MDDKTLLELAARAPGYLHIYGQEFWHSDAAIIGDRQGLILLRDQIDRVLAGASRVETNEGYDFFQNDGEGYPLHIALATEEEFNALASAYNDTSICGGAWSVENSPLALIERLTKAAAEIGKAMGVGE